jgi:hypothetical protein
LYLLRQSSSDLGATMNGEISNAVAGPSKPPPAPMAPPTASSSYAPPLLFLPPPGQSLHKTPVSLADSRLHSSSSPKAASRKHTGPPRTLPAPLRLRPIRSALHPPRRRPCPPATAKRPPNTRTWRNGFGVDSGQVRRPFG